MVIYWHYTGRFVFESDPEFSVWYNAKHDGTMFNGNSTWLIPTWENFDAAS